MPYQEKNMSCQIDNFFVENIHSNFIDEKQINSLTIAKCKG
jgi:hypothetical protein